MYTFRSPWKRRMICSIIWFVSLIVKLREMVWTICAKSPLSLAALLILTSNVGINKLFLRGSWLANCHSINWFIGALNSLWARVACCSWWISSVDRAVSDRLGWLMCPSLSQSSLKLCPSMTGHVVYIRSYPIHSIAHPGCKVNRHPGWPQACHPVIQKVSVQRRRHGNWVLLTHLPTQC